MRIFRPQLGYIQRLSVGVILAILLLSPVVTADEAHAQKADVVYTNGKIYTVNEKQPWAEAVAIKDGKFVKVGSAARGSGGAAQAERASSSMSRLAMSVRFRSEP